MCILHTNQTSVYIKRSSFVPGIEKCKLLLKKGDTSFVNNKLNLLFLTFLNFVSGNENL